MSKYNSGGIFGTQDEEFVFDWAKIADAADDIINRHQLPTVSNAEEGLMDSEPSSNTDLTFSDTMVHVKCWSDGTTTRVQIVGEHENSGMFGTRKEQVLLGEGTARRRKGDRRDKEIGFALATARALQHAADLQKAEAEKMLEG